jgi:hypothetical protein
VLAPLAENRLFLATGNYGLTWLWRPGVLCFFAVIFGSLVYPCLKKTWQQRTSAPQPTAPDSLRHHHDRPLRLSWGAAFSACLVVLLGWALWTSCGFGFRAGLFPWAIGLPVFALALLQLALELRGRAGSIGMAGAAVTEGDLPTPGMYRRTAGFAGWIIGFFGALWLLGITMAVPVTTLLYLKVGAGEKWPISLLVTAGAWLFFYGLFVYALRLPFPEGVFFSWLG